MYEPGFCDPANFSQEPSLSVGSSDPYYGDYEYAVSPAPQGLSYNSVERMGDPWWTSNEPGQRHHGWQENTKFYELQSYGKGSTPFSAPMTPSLRKEEQQRLAQLNIPMSFMDFYPNGVYTRKYGYGDYIDQPPGSLVSRPYPDKLAEQAPEDLEGNSEHFTNGQSPWYASSDPWYANNFADDIDYGTYDSKRYQPIYRAASEARTQELGALYNNGGTGPGIETFTTAGILGNPYPSVSPEAAARINRIRKQENLIVNASIPTADKKKRTLVF